MIITAKDIGGRSYMEDEISIEINLLPNVHYYAVFDGHGTGAVSSYLKDNMGKYVKSQLVALSLITPQGVLEALFKAFQAVVETIPMSISRHAGSTAVVAIKAGEHLWIANCGDSRAVMNFGNTAVGITVDHKPTRKDEYLRILACGGKVIKAHPDDVERVDGTLALSRAIGDFELYPHVTWKPEIYYTRIISGNDYLVIATDGLWDVFSNEDLVSFINKKVQQHPIDEIGNILVKEARSRHSTDNIAIVLILI